MFKRDWTKELETKAQDELNEVPNKKEEDVNNVREWLLARPHLNANTDREWILNFLRGCKFDLEKTKEKLEYLYKTRLVASEFYSNRDPSLPELQEILNRCIVLPHSTKNEELMIVRWVDTDVNKVSFVNLLKLSFMIMELTLMESSSYLILGYHIIIDLKNFPLSYIRQMSPFMLRRAINLFLKAYPTRIKGIYLCNAFTYFPTVFSMFTPFISKKILERIKIYNNFDLQELSKYVSLENIPKEYGGNSESVYDIGARWKALLESYREWLLEDGQYKANVNLTKHEIIDVGLAGSFKKLEVD